MEEDMEKEDEKRKKEEGENAGFVRTTLSPAIAACMAKFGVPIEKITEILRSWSHLKGEALMRRLVEFISAPARASAHLLVQFDVRGGFALVTDFLSKLTGRNSSLTTKPTADKNQPKPR